MNWFKNFVNKSSLEIRGLPNRQIGSCKILLLRKTNKTFSKLINKINLSLRILNFEYKEPRTHIFEIKAGPPRVPHMPTTDYEGTGRLIFF